jgi:acetyl-CoA carboxylase biotin carboxyl carrier protein
MSGTTPPTGDAFDVRRIRRLVELMNEFDLSSIELKDGDRRINLKRGAETVFTAAPVQHAHVSPAAPAPSAGSSPVAPAAPAAEALSANMIEVVSPMVGTFYSAANPDAPPFVKVGDQVGPDTTVCIIEAMKVFNQIPAEKSGRIAAVLVENGDPVEYGQPMFRIDTSK